MENRFPMGASGARNTGAFSVGGEVIAFLDDDAVAHPTWLERLLEPFNDTSVVGVGGGVDPGWEVCRPSWFPDEFFWLVGATPPEGPAGVHEVRNVWAENMAVRRERFVSVGGFRIDFGKVGSHSSPEDTDLCIRMAEDGGRWLMVPEARVTHHVPSVRSTFRFFIRRSFNEGEGKAALRALAPAGSLALEQDYATKVLPTAFLRGVREAWREKSPQYAAMSGAVAAGALAAGTGYAWGAVSLLRASTHTWRRHRHGERAQRAGGLP